MPTANFRINSDRKKNVSGKRKCSEFERKKQEKKIFFPFYLLMNCENVTNCTALTYDNLRFFSISKT